MKRRFFIPVILILMVGVVLVAGLFLLFDNGKKATGDVAILKIEGVLYDSLPLLEQIRDISENKDVKGVVVRIDSPGGTVGASQEVYEALKRLKEHKKIAASMGTVAASGGYYVALPADRIFANEGTITGSIGVKMDLVNVGSLMKWALLQPETLKSGALKDLGSSTRPMTDEERGLLNALLAEMHEQFKTAVATARGLDPEVVESLADGGVLTGATAKAKGLVDDIGGLDTAIDWVATAAGIKGPDGLGKPEIFYPEDKYKKFWEQLVESGVRSVVARVMDNFSVPVFKAL